MQKHCRCPGPPVPVCCKTGWITVYCGSKFNTPAESRCTPVEGEGFAAVHGLEKCSPFILGHPNLLLALDHKPLIKIFGNASLESISSYSNDTGTCSQSQAPLSLSMRGQ